MTMINESKTNLGPKQVSKTLVEHWYRQKITCVYTCVATGLFAFDFNIYNSSFMRFAVT